MTAALDYDPFSPVLQADPYRTYAEMRARGPVHHNEDMRFFAYVRQADVAAAFVDHERYTTRDGVTMDPTQSAVEGLMTFDPPEHSWHRRPFAKLFTPRQMARLDPLIRQQVNRLLDAAAGVGEIDAVEESRTRRTFSTNITGYGYVPIELAP